MSNLQEHDAEQAAITAMCDAGTCGHAECKPTWNDACNEVIDRDQHDNDHRAARVVRCIYPAYDNDTLESAATDVLSDILHLCDLMGWSFDDLQKRARGHYCAEIQDHNGTACDNDLRAALKRDLQ